MPNVVAYEEWLAEADGDFAWKELDESAACGMCYTSGTTGDPKGVVYSHRSNVLHAMIACMPDAMGISSRDVILPVVPMFHANAWGLAQAAPMIGAKLVMPGGKMDGAVDLRTARHREGDFLGRRADGLADAAAISRGDRQEAAASEEGGDRRLGLPARHHREVPGQLRCRGRSTPGA